MSNRIRTAVIGVGHLGREHARVMAALEQSHLVAVCDTNENAGKAVAEKLGVGYVGDYRELLGQVEAVSIALRRSITTKPPAHSSLLVFIPSLRSQSLERSPRLMR